MKMTGTWAVALATVLAVSAVHTVGLAEAGGGARSLGARHATPLPTSTSPATGGAATNLNGTATQGNGGKDSQSGDSQAGAKLGNAQIQTLMSDYNEAQTPLTK